MAYGVSVFFGILIKARAGAFRVGARVIVYENGVLSVSKAIYGNKNSPDGRLTSEYESLKFDGEKFLIKK